MLALMLLLILADGMLINRSMLGQLGNWMFVRFNVRFDTFATLLLALMLLVLIMPIARRQQLTTINLGSCANPATGGQQERGKMKSQHPPTMAKGC
jgi:hypothetical protein